MALAYAPSMATEYSSELILANVPEDGHEPGAIKEFMIRTSARLSELVSEERFQANCQKVVRVGKPYQQIIALSVEAHCDLVIMSERGANALERAVFGSTTHRVIQLGHRPVLVLRGGRNA